MKKSFDDVLLAVIEKLNSPEIEVARDVAVASIGVANPAAGVIASIGNGFLSKFDDFKLHCLLRGLSKDLNMETRINQLYGYVCSSQTRAFQVGNVIKEAIAAESPKSCVILGIMLAKHMGKDTDFTRDELIVCKAVENASDYDLESFCTLMKKCIEKQEDGRRKIVYNTNDSALIAEYDTTCSWCVFNRLFIEVPMEWGVIGETLKATPAHYYVEWPADILLGLIDEVKQIWQYEKK